MKKNICFFIGHLNHSGGTERVTTLIANELVKNNFNVSILSLSDGQDPFFSLDNNIKTFSLYSNKVSMKKHFFGALWKIRKFIISNNIDTLIVVDSILCVFTVPALLGLKLNHICWEHFNFNVDLGVYFRPLGRKLAAKYCDYVITLTRRDKELWENGLKKINAQLVPIPNPTPYQNMNNFPTMHHKYILAIGRLTYQKGFDLLIKSWAQCCKKNKEWILRIVGSGEDEKHLKEQAQQLNILDRIEFIPVTNDVEKYYKTSSFYCLSSRFEGFGMVIIEAMSFGLPCISFNCNCGPSDLILDKENGFLVEAENINELAEKLFESINLSTLEYNRMCNNSLLISKKFYLQNIIKIWLKVI